MHISQIGTPQKLENVKEESSWDRTSEHKPIKIESPTTIKLQFYDNHFSTQSTPEKAGKIVPEIKKENLEEESSDGDYEDEELLL